jgi:very-short-patch-repair endonuclease
MSCSPPSPVNPSPLAGEGGSAAALPGERDMLKLRARKMQRVPTQAEKKLWYALRDRRFVNWKFRRQVPLGPYIADFLCFETKLVIEVDGGQHDENLGDEMRTRWFREHGFTVLRFWNSDVLTNLEGVLIEIERTPHPARRKSGSPPSPAWGEGGTQSNG